jgi:phosphoribosylformylglycinamidine synthase subunit PurQ / glutaminase
MKKPKALVVTGFGINCEEETAAAFRFAEAEAEIVFLNRIFYGEINIHDYDILAIPGGFSFGDDLGSGKVLANKMRYKKLPGGTTLLDELKIFLKEGKIIIGICNGFQVLVRLGFLPNTEGNFAQEATLAHNESGKFINDWCGLKVNNDAVPFLKDIQKIELPIRHGEGRLIIKNEIVRRKIIEQKLHCLLYEKNPNGSELDCAGLTDPSFQVFGLMPHPEAFLTPQNHPAWGSGEQVLTQTGLKIFSNIVNSLIVRKEKQI